MLHLLQQKLGAPDLVPKIRYTSESDRYNLSYLNLWHWQPGVVFANDVCSVIMPRSKELSEAFGKKDAAECSIWNSNVHQTVEISNDLSRTV